MMIEKQILELAIENLRKQIHSIEILPIPQVGTNRDAYLCIAGIPFKYEAKQNVNNSNFLSTLNICHSRQIGLLIVRNINRTTMERLAEEGVNVIDVCGNCIIDVQGKLQIRIFGIKNDLPITNESMNFRFAGFKVLFSLLSMTEQQVPTIREIAAISGASIGTVKHVIDVLQSNGYIFTSGKGKFLKDRERLLDEWVRMFNVQQRAELQVGRASWLKPAKDWQDITLPDGMIWGGDCGAYLLTGFMTPANFCIYTDMPVKDIVKTKMLVPNKEGDVVFYKKFWDGNLSELGYAIICYADLINQNNSRCLEAAKVIRNERLTYTK